MTTATEGDFRLRESPPTAMPQADRPFSFFDAPLNRFAKSAYLIDIIVLF